ncbi:hypothetical protein SDC9_90272 [bioreactor metagenome]|uniref:Uncharacterized protein n=1 Tax=bioreactor metagenome TaxID=1076179 RepID=A0A644ZRT7_9ZZZZ
MEGSALAEALGAGVAEEVLAELLHAARPNTIARTSKSAAIFFILRSPLNLSSEQILFLPSGEGETATVPSK